MGLVSIQARRKLATIQLHKQTLTLEMRSGFSLYKQARIGNNTVAQADSETRETKQENGGSRFLLQSIIQRLCSSVGGIPSTLGLCSHWLRRESTIS